MPGMTENDKAAFQQIIQDVKENCSSSVQRALSSLTPKALNAAQTNADLLIPIIQNCLGELAKIVSPKDAAAQARLISHALKVVSYGAELKLDYGFDSSHAPIAYQLYHYLMNAHEVLDISPIVVEDPASLFKSPDLDNNFNDVLFKTKMLCLRIPDESSLVQALNQHILAKTADGSTSILTAAVEAKRPTEESAGSSLHQKTFETVQKVGATVSDLITSYQSSATNNAFVIASFQTYLDAIKDKFSKVDNKDLKAAITEFEDALTASKAVASFEKLEQPILKLLSALESLRSNTALHDQALLALNELKLISHSFGLLPTRLFKLENHLAYALYNDILHLGKTLKPALKAGTSKESTGSFENLLAQAKLFCVAHFNDSAKLKTEFATRILGIEKDPSSHALSLNMSSFGAYLGSKLKRSSSEIELLKHLKAVLSERLSTAQIMAKAEVTALESPATSSAEEVTDTSVNSGAGQIAATEETNGLGARLAKFGRWAWKTFCEKPEAPTTAPSTESSPGSTSDSKAIDETHIVAPASPTAPPVSRTPADTTSSSEQRGRRPLTAADLTKPAPNLLVSGSKSLNKTSDDESDDEGDTRHPKH